MTVLKDLAREGDARAKKDGTGGQASTLGAVVSSTKEAKVAMFRKRFEVTKGRIGDAWALVAPFAEAQINAGSTVEIHVIFDDAQMERVRSRSTSPAKKRKKVKTEDQAVDEEVQAVWDKQVPS
jgi:hypothetical protein